MNREHRDNPDARPGFGRRLLATLLEGADEALRDARRTERERAAEDEQCRLRPEHSRLTRGYREIRPPAARSHRPPPFPAAPFAADTAASPPDCAAAAVLSASFAMPPIADSALTPTQPIAASHIIGNTM